MISPPPADSSPLLSCTVRTPSFMLQPRVGNLSDFGLRQPSVVLPSHSNFQPAAFSVSVSVLFAAKIGSVNENRASLSKIEVRIDVLDVIIGAKFIAMMQTTPRH